MLVLTRKINQEIRLGDSITVKILRVQGNSIRVGIEAPRDVRVVRGELEMLDGQEMTLELDAAEPAVTKAVEEEAAEDEPAAESASASSDPASDKPQVYQLRARAPLARFLPGAARESVATYSI